MRDLRIVLVGSTYGRRRLRAILPPGIDVVGETASLRSADAFYAQADGYLVAAAQAADVAEPLVEPLTRRETEVLELLAEGLTNKAIAARLGLSDETVKFHLTSIFGKLGASNRTDAVRQALRRGVIAL